MKNTPSLTQRLQEARTECAGLLAMRICSYRNACLNRADASATVLTVPCADCLELARDLTKDAFAACELLVTQDERDRAGRKVQAKAEFRRMHGY